MCTHCQIEPKTHNVYSIHSSLVERQLSIRGGRGSSPGKNNIFKLGLPPSQNENAGLEPSNEFSSGAFKISGAFRK
jgi:hypothetical protein